MPPESVAVCADQYFLTVAPRFQLRRSFVGRVDRNTGVDRRGNRLYPRNDWRTLEAKELSALVRGDSDPRALLPPTHLGLLQIPERIRSAWWTEAEKEASDQGFDRVFSALVDFLRFKRLPLPERVHLEVSVNAPPLASSRATRDEVQQGLAYRDGTPARNGQARQVLGLVNLGDETTSVVLLELPPATLAARLEAAGLSGASGLSPGQLVDRFFELFPRQPLLRVRLEPGEGLWLSPEGVVHDGWTDEKRDLDVVLRIRVEVGKECEGEQENTRVGGAFEGSEWASESAPATLTKPLKSRRTVPAKSRQAKR